MAPTPTFLDLDTDTILAVYIMFAISRAYTFYVDVGEFSRRVPFARAGNTLTVSSCICSANTD